MSFNDANRIIRLWAQQLEHHCAKVAPICLMNALFRSSQAMKV